MTQHENPGYYSEAGDCIFYHLEDVGYYAERIDDIVTLYKSDDDKRIVGFQIKGIKALMEGRVERRGD